MKITKKLLLLLIFAMLSTFVTYSSLQAFEITGKNATIVFIDNETMKGTLKAVKGKAEQQGWYELITDKEPYRYRFNMLTTKNIVKITFTSRDGKTVTIILNTIKV